MRSILFSFIIILKDTNYFVRRQLLFFFVVRTGFEPVCHIRSRYLSYMGAETARVPASTIVRDIPNLPPPDYLIILIW